MRRARCRSASRTTSWRASATGRGSRAGARSCSSGRGGGGGGGGGGDWREAGGGLREDGVMAGDRERLYLDDLDVGQRFASGPHTVDEAAIKAFAREFD